MLYLGSDHGGFTLKEALKRRLLRAGIRFIDVGPTQYNHNDDYPDVSRSVASFVAQKSIHRGILLCRSGVGVAIAANKHAGIRAVLAQDTWIAKRARRDDNTNVLALPAERLTETEAWQVVKAWMAQPFRASSRDLRRLKKISEFEREH